MSTSLGTRLTRLLIFLQAEATFFRVHLLCFIFIPLIFSGIFYASNGRFRISFLDSLFLCYSAMTVTGLTTVNLSTITAFQQVILYLLMVVGDITFVSWIVVLVRKRFFRVKCEYIVSNSRHKPKGPQYASRTAFLDAISGPVSVSPLNDVVPSPDLTPEQIEKLRLSRRISRDASSDDTTHSLPKDEPKGGLNASSSHAQYSEVLHSSPVVGTSQPLPHSSTIRSRPTIEFRIPTTTSARRRLTTIAESVPYSGRRLAVPRSPLTSRGTHKHLTSSKFSNFGGFPGPIDLLRHLFPKTYRSFKRKFTLPRTTTFVSARFDEDRHDTIRAPWLPFDGLVVRRNSFFHTDSLTAEQLEAIGGVEYRALRLLSYLVVFYFVGCQLFSLILIAPWLSSTSRYDSVFQSQPRLVSKPWFSLFQVMSAYTGGGLSLVDTGMVPFQKAYLMIFSMIFVVLAGNNALPILMRLIIWIYSKLVSRESELYETLKFLLHHPRRCYIYLFPMHQTWFLVACLVLFSIMELFCFLVLDIGLPVTQSVPFGNRFVLGLFQGLAARASGFSIVAVADLAPAVQFLYIVMMYIAIYPIALTIRATNVYEERSLGIYEDSLEDEDDEPELSGTQRERIGKYLNWHLRRQLSIDIWWIVWGVFLVCIIERHNLLDQSKKWFDIFRIIFELVSAFGGIGLSLGIPTENFSFSGALRPLSKLVIIVIMIRGRHRGLPLAIDRSILLPTELAMQPAENEANAA